MVQVYIQHAVILVLLITIVILLWTNTKDYKNKTIEVLKLENRHVRSLLARRVYENIAVYVPCTANNIVDDQSWHSITEPVEGVHPRLGYLGALCYVIDEDGKPLSDGFHSIKGNWNGAIGKMGSTTYFMGKGYKVKQRLLYNDRITPVIVDREEVLKGELDRILETLIRNTEGETK